MHNSGSAMLDLVCRTLCEKPQTAALARRMRAKSFAWPHYLEVASRNLVTTALPAHLQAHGVWHLVPDEVQQGLAAILELSAERHTQQTLQMEALIDLLTAAGIQPVFLKGTACLIEGLYPQPGSRLMYDLDLLTSAAQFGTCIELLERQGYCAEDAEMVLYLRKHGDRARHGSAAIRHYPRLFHPQFISGVEVHCSLFGEAAGELQPAANVVRDARPVSWRGRMVLVPSLRDQLLHNMLHNTELAPFVWTAEPQSLRQSVDLTRLATLATEPDWQSAFKLLRAHGDLHRLGLYLAFLDGYLKFRPPVRTRTPWAGLYRLQSAVHAYRGFHLLAYWAHRAWKMVEERRFRSVLRGSFYRGAAHHAAEIWSGYR